MKRREHSCLRVFGHDPIIWDFCNRIPVRLSITHTLGFLFSYSGNFRQTHHTWESPSNAWESWELLPVEEPTIVRNDHRAAGEIFNRFSNARSVLISISLVSSFVKHNTFDPSRNAMARCTHGFLRPDNTSSFLLWSVPLEIEFTYISTRIQSTSANYHRICSSGNDSYTLFSTTRSSSWSPTYAIWTVFSDFYSSGIGLFWPMISLNKSRLFRFHSSNHTNNSRRWKRECQGFQKVILCRQKICWHY